MGGTLVVQSPVAGLGSIRCQTAHGRTFPSMPTGIGAAFFPVLDG